MLHVFIPARYGSSRFPGKPLHSLKGKPLIWHTYAAVCRAVARTQHEGARVHVVTDDSRIAQFCEDARISCIMAEGPFLSGSDRVAHAVRSLMRLDTHPSKRVLPSDIVVNWQGDAPLTPVRGFADLVERIRRDVAGAYDMYTIAWGDKADFSLGRKQAVTIAASPDGTGLYRAHHFTRSIVPMGMASKSRPKCLYHIGLYGWRAGSLCKLYTNPAERPALEAVEDLEQIRPILQGHSIAVIETRRTGPLVELNNPEDAARLEELLP